MEVHVLSEEGSDGGERRRKCLQLLIWEMRKHV